MNIAITGTPGTGKTEVSRHLAVSLGFALLSVNGFAKHKGIVEGLDEKRDSYVIDELRLRDEFDKLKGNYVVDGHLSHFCSVDLVVVLRANPKVLRSRLKRRGWKKEKIDENIDSEIASVCLEEAIENNENIIEIDTSSKKPEDISALVYSIIDKKEFERHRPGKIDWVSYL